MFGKAGTLVFVVLVFCLALSSAGGAVPTIYCDPPLVTAGVGDTLEVRIMVNADAETLSSFYAVFQFDPSVLQFLPPAIEGSLFVNAGDTTFTYFNSGTVVSPGHWQVSDVLFPGMSYVMAPGELCRLRFKALTDGVSDITFGEVWLTDRLRQYIHPVETTGGRICVGNQAGTDGGPGVEGLGLGLPYPNPASGEVFIPVVSRSGDPVGATSVTVHDAAGRLIAVRVYSSNCRQGCVVWDGRDSAGRKVGAGTYFVRLGVAGDEHVRKILVVR